MNPVKPYLILSQDCWQIKVRLPAQPTMETAEKSANSPHLDIRFVRVDGRPAIQTTIAGESITHFDEDVVIEELSDTKRAVMGKPLDATDPGDGDIMIRALKDEDPSYTMTSADMVPSSRHIKDFLDVYGEGYRPECIAFGVESAVA